MSANIEDYLKEGLINIIGGCCGSTPSHIAVIAKIARNYKPRDLPDVTRHDFFSGLEPLYISDNTIRIKNTVNADNRKEFLQLLEEGEYEEAVDIARDMVDGGVVIIDVETDDKNVMCKFLDFALMNPYVAKVPFFINSSRFEVLETGLKRLQGRGLAGPISLEDGEAEFLRKAELIRRYGAAALITPVDEQGHAETDERKIEIARRVYFLLQNNGYPLENIVFDFLTTENDDSIFSRIRDNCPGTLIAL
jgi:5-methyltetrahydrofolate--homocysteine methyltransferase